MIEIKVTTTNAYTRVDGYLENREIISVSNYIDNGWSVGSSSCLPSNIDKAVLYMDVMNKVFAEVNKLKELQ